MDAGAEAQGGPTSAAGGGMGKPIIAVFNSSSDTVELLRTVLEEQGFHTIVGHIPELKSGQVDLIAYRTKRTGTSSVLCAAQST
jgi:hypothetical protein